MIANSFTDQVFAYRNKEYGAYQLRKNEPKRLLLAMSIVYFFAGLLIVAAQLRDEIFAKNPSAPILSSKATPNEDEVMQEWIQDIDVTKNSSSTGMAPSKRSEQRTNTQNASNNYLIGTNTDAIWADNAEGITDIGIDDDAPGGNTENNMVILGEEKKAEPTLVLLEQASFPGGEAELEKFIKENFDFPKSEISGVLTISFEIDELGQVSKIQVLKGFPGSDKFEKEAIRVLSAMPRWTPKTINGKPFKTKRELRINCRI